MVSHPAKDLLVKAVRTPIQLVFLSTVMAVLMGQKCGMPVNPPVSIVENQISGGGGQNVQFAYDIPAGATTLSVLLWALQGDPDLYVAYDRPATIADYDCLSAAPEGQPEACVLDPAEHPEGGTYHVTIRGASAFSEVTLIVQYRAAASPCGDPLDCAGVCGGSAFLDSCDRCVGGNTGLEPAVEDVNENGVPDLCDDACLTEARFIAQWSGVPLYDGVGTYTFQAILHESGDLLFQYGDVLPYDASATVGLQSGGGTESIQFGFNSPFVAQQPTVSVARESDGTYIADYSEPLYWLDVRQLGTALTLSDDEEVVVPVGFDFPFYETSYDSIAISSNGFLGLSGPYGEYTNQFLPAPALGALVAPLWDDFNPSVTGEVHYYVAPPTCAVDCNGVLGGFGVPDECGTCSTELESGPFVDCTGLCGGTAVIDGCGQCAGGTTGIEPMDVDCNGDCGGTAFVDACNLCVGGTTGLPPSDPTACAQGVDLIVDEPYFAETVELDYVFVGGDNCLIAEGCVQGPGNRKVIRFGTFIANVGTEDLQLGTPESGGEFWHYDECHSHFHFEAYAAYDIYDVSNDQGLNIGSKNGFCVLDSEVYDSSIAPDGCNGYFCGNQGITAGCGDIYHSGLQCQWIDVTGLPDGLYDLIVTTNPLQEIPETNYNNNSATVRVQMTGDSVTVLP